MPYTRSTFIEKAAPVGSASRRHLRQTGPWHKRPGRFPSIVRYTDGAVPSNEYPARIVSPLHPAACCASSMVNVGDPAEENGWLFQYRRCPRCGFTVRRILREVPDEELLAELRFTLAHAFVRNAREAA